ncbi:alcohol dehydrogenase zinc-binding domain protein [Mycobacterium kansasii]|uniref:Alcohol dehydrogenase zinc-binding domain protein n=1 Tax=Mycobacterium kansasii TaxID=1768 RepID=A0A1V3X944_MYCKA|nr:alcohol dehydrogenase zinc-binding domain protein [Mycobacterium kansasii]
MADSNTGIDVTNVPGGWVSVSGPASSISALNSWPMKTSLFRSTSRRPAPRVISSVSASISSPCAAKCRSEPQIPHASTLTSTWPGPGAGSGTSSRYTIRPLRNTEARISSHHAGARPRAR